MQLFLSEKTRLYRRVPAPRNNVEKRLHVEAGGAYQGARPLRLTGENRNFFGLDAAAIDYSAELSGLRSKPLLQPLTNVAMRFRRLRRRGVAPGPDRPHRLLGGCEWRERR